MTPKEKTLLPKFSMSQQFKLCNKFKARNKTSSVTVKTFCIKTVFWVVSVLLNWDNIFTEAF
jgi:hypothetical protein